MFLVVEKKHYGKYIALVAFLVLIMFVSKSYSYFDTTGDSAAITNATATVHVEGGLSFSNEENITLSLDRENFGEGAGNLSDSIKAKATLIAGTERTHESDFYNVYLNIAKNGFKYSTNDNKTELLLKIKNPSGTYLNAIEGLEYDDENEGFDITEKTGLIEIAINQNISVGNKSKIVDEWEFELTFINLETNQSINEGKSIEIKVLLQKEEFLYPTLAPSNTWYSEIESSVNDITNITVLDSYTPTGTESKTWDCSNESTGLVTCYLDSTGKKITIVGNGTGNIYANEDSSNAFSFASIEQIEGLEILNTSNVTNMSRMFYGTGTSTMFDIGDISNWDTSNVLDMSEMFAYSGTGTRTYRIDISNWNMSNVNNVKDMFAESGTSSLIWYVLIPPTNGNRVKNTQTRIVGKKANIRYTIHDRSFTIMEYEEDEEQEE